MTLKVIGITASGLTTGAGRAPTATAILGRYTHTSASGFCMVCGSVWPCAQAVQSTRADSGIRSR